MTDNSIPSFADMLNILKRNPFKALQLAGKAHRGVNRRSWEIAGIACGFARILIDDEKARDDFYDEDFFDDRKRSRPDKLLLHVFAYLYGALTGPAYNRASEHARALKKVCDNRDFNVADIPQYIAEHGGFDGLLNEQEDDQENDQEDSSDTMLAHGGREARAIRRPTEQGPTLNSPSDDPDDEDLAPDEDEDHEPATRPQGKAPELEHEEHKLILLPQEYIYGCIILRPKPGEFAKIMKAYVDGKEVCMTTGPGHTSSSHELYAGAGPYVEALIKEHDAS